MIGFGHKMFVSNMISNEIADMEKDLFYFRNSEIGIKTLHDRFKLKTEKIMKMINDCTPKGWQGSEQNNDTGSTGK